jgi:hypothetical protein
VRHSSPTICSTRNLVRCVAQPGGGASTTAPVLSMCKPGRSPIDQKHNRPAQSFRPCAIGRQLALTETKAAASPGGRRSAGASPAPSRTFPAPQGGALVQSIEASWCQVAASPARSPICGDASALSNFSRRRVGASQVDQARLCQIVASLFDADPLQHFQRLLELSPRALRGRRPRYRSWPAGPVAASPARSPIAGDRNPLELLPRRRGSFLQRPSPYERLAVPIRRPQAPAPAEVEGAPAHTARDPYAPQPLRVRMRLQPQQLLIPPLDLVKTLARKAADRRLPACLLQLTGGYCARASTGTSPRPSSPSRSAGRA